MSNMKISINNVNTVSLHNAKIGYTTTMNTSGGQIIFDNIAELNKEDGKYKIEWSSNVIFPNLNDQDKVKVSSEIATRGRILDRNGIDIATNGTASSVGIVPGKLGENKENNINTVAELLKTTSEAINSKISASWVKGDSFVPIKTISSNETALKDKLLQIPGIKITSTNTRIYPFSEIASHLTGYVGQVTKEDLEKNVGYTSSSIIGKAGLEKKYEERLKGKNGLEIYIVDNEGNRKGTIIKKEKTNGEDIKLTIDSTLQNDLYKQLKNDKGLFVVMNHQTGEILALVSTPGYDVNKMTLGISSEEWKQLQEDTSTPLISRYQQSYCPGSTFKALTGAIGLSSNSLTSDDIFNYSGLSWQKDKSWGTYSVTTLTGYSGAKNLKNALIHSDNIYFAQAVLKIGKNNFIEGLKKLKFGDNIDFDLNLTKSQYSNSDTIKSEGALADSGFGQGEILVNPIHMASIYSAFTNNGNMLKPYLEYTESIHPEFLVENAFSETAANTIKEDLIQVVENPEGTAKYMRINGITIAGKTGTAELKANRDSTGNTLGWFDCFTLDYDTPYLIIGMVEDAGNNGGSHHIIPMIKNVLVK